MNRSLFLRIFIGFFLITFVLAAYILLFSFGTMENYYLGTTRFELENLGHALLPSVDPLFSKGDYSSLDRLVKRVGGETDRRVTVIAADGTVRADSTRDPALMENHGGRQEVRQALFGETGTALRFSGTMREEMLYVAIPLRVEGKVAGVLRVSIFMTELNNLMRRIRLRILLVSAVIIALSLLGAFFFSGSILNPIRQLIEAARRVALGDFNTKVFLRRKDEIKVLADNYNFMTEKIKGYVSELTAQREELKTIISSMQPGLLVLAMDGRVTLSNRSAERLFHVENLQEKRYWEVIDVPEIFQLVQRVQSEKGNLTGETRMNGSWFQVSAAFIEPTKETVLILSDITELKNLERVKRDFVMNVSHELRTPLTAIKGYAETIEGIGSENFEYLNVIKRHTERLINIVQDLLTLSELEERGASQPFEIIRLDRIASQVLRLFEDAARRRGLALSLRVEGELPEVYGDPFRMEQLFINLIDNSLKYTEKGGVTVTLKPVDSPAAGPGAVVVVQDTGIGIPEQHIPRIFERFYTVDKSRSRKLGGTGLGLAIVKHIVILHHGSVDVESTPGEGTTFTVRFPASLGSSPPADAEERGPEEAGETNPVKA
jgi:two-component system phosphate regulon sensor histidine kinase PhoR